MTIDDFLAGVIGFAVACILLGVIAMRYGRHRQ